MGPVTVLAGVCLQDVERGAHEGGKRPLASRLRPVSSKATHPPTYLPLHSVFGPARLDGRARYILGGVGWSRSSALTCSCLLLVNDASCCRVCFVSWRLHCWASTCKCLDTRGCQDMYFGP